MLFFKAYLETGKNTTDRRALYKYYLGGADSYYFIEGQEAAVAYYDMAGEAARLTDYQKGVGVSKLYKGGSLGLMGKFSEASQILQKAATIFQKAKDTFNIISAKNSLSILYSQNAFLRRQKRIVMMLFF